MGIAAALLNDLMQVTEEMENAAIDEIRDGRSGHADSREIRKAEHQAMIRSYAKTNKIDLREKK